MGYDLIGCNGHGKNPIWPPKIHILSYICVRIFTNHQFAILRELAAVTQGIDIPGFTSAHTTCKQYIADNVDHSLVTVDCTGTFHGMGIIAAVTPGTQAKKHIPKANATAADIDAVGRINIRYFKNPPALPPLTYLPLVLLEAKDPTAQLEELTMEELTIPSLSKTRMGWYDADVASWSTPRKGLSDVLSND